MPEPIGKRPGGLCGARPGRPPDRGAQKRRQALPYSQAGICAAHVLLLDGGERGSRKMKAPPKRGYFSFDSRITARSFVDSGSLQP